MRFISDSEELINKLIKGTDDWYKSTCPWPSAKLLTLVPSNHPWLAKAIKFNSDFNKHRYDLQKIDKDVVLDVLFGIDLLMDIDLDDDFFSVAIDVTTNSSAIALKVKKNQDPIRVKVRQELGIQHHLIVVVQSNIDFDCLSTNTKKTYISQIELAIKSLSPVVYLD